MDRITLAPIGVLRTPFPEKFGIPRQPGLVREAIGTLELPNSLQHSVRGLENFSHAWLIFVFDRAGSGSSALVRPPRLGGEEKVGVFATRSPHRPNPVGISAFEIESVVPAERGKKATIRFRGVDLLDGTPVLDVKPYLPYFDAIPRARGAPWTEAAYRRKGVRVLFSREAARACVERGASHPGLRGLVRKLLAQDPRPAFQARRGVVGRAESGVYSMRVLDLDVHWRAEKSGEFVVVGIEKFRG